MTENNNNKLDIMCLDLVNRSVSKVKDNVGELNDVEHNNIFLNIVDDKLFFYGVSMKPLGENYILI